MRVLHIIPSVGPVYGGPSRVIPELAQALAIQGVSVDIATTNANGCERLRVPLGIPVGEGGVRTFYFPYRSLQGATYSLPLVEWVLRKNRDYDLIHVSALFSFTTLATLRVAQWGGRPVVVSPHGMLDAWALGRKAWKKVPYFRLLERPALQRANALHALTRNEAARFLALGLSTPTFIIPNGIELDAFSALPSPGIFRARYPQLQGRTVVLFLGRIDPKKGLDLLVRAFARTVRRRSRVAVPCLVIAGPDLIGYRSVVERLVAEEDIADHVLFTGMLSGHDKLAALSTADVFVLPSRSEGLPVALLEGLAAGVPAIVTEACNLQGIEEARAGITTKADVHHLEESLATLLGDLTLAREMGHRGRHFVCERFNWTALSREMVRVYQDLLDRTRASSAWIC